METNLDEVEVDEDGNLREANSGHRETVDEMETNIDGSYVDEDGNLRIHASNSLLNSSKYATQEASILKFQKVTEVSEILVSSVLERASCT